MLHEHTLKSLDRFHAVFDQLVEINFKGVYRGRDKEAGERSKAGG